MKTYFNLFHLGDCIQNILYLNYLSCECVFYCNEAYHNQLRQIITASITLKSGQPPADAINLWCNRTGDFFKLCKEYNNDTHSVFEKIYNCPKSVFIPNLLVQASSLPDFNINQYNLRKKVLIINSNPSSGQVDWSKWNAQMDILLSTHDKSDIITTQKLPNILSTADFKHTVFEIGFVSMFVNKIIAIDTAPLHLCLNKYNMDRNLPIYVHHNRGLIPKYKNIHLI